MDKKKYYVVDKDVREISEGFLRFEVDTETGEVIGLDRHPGLAEVLCRKGIVFAKTLQKRSKRVDKNAGTIENDEKGETVFIKT